MARPTKLTEELQRTIVNAIIEGASIADAARHAGLHPSTIYEWQSRGRAILAGEITPKPSPLELACPSCEAAIGVACHSLRSPEKLIAPHKSRNQAAQDPKRDKAYSEFAEAMEGASATGVVLDLRTIGIASRPRKVARTTTKVFPVKIRGEVLLDEHGAPIMASETTTTEWEEVDAKPAQWRLARRRPDEFGDRITQRIEGELGLTPSGPTPLSEETDDARNEAIVAALLGADAIAGLDAELERLTAGRDAPAPDAETGPAVLPAEAAPEAEGVPPPP